MCDVDLDKENMIVACIHVINGEREAEADSNDKLCADCWNVFERFSESNKDKALENLRVVCADCGEKL